MELQNYSQGPFIEKQLRIFPLGLEIIYLPAIYRHELKLTNEVP